MGVERAVTRWYVQRQAILQEIAQLETRLAQFSAPIAISEDEKAQPEESVPTSEKESVVVAELQQQLAGTRAKLQALGPCPKPMMG